MKQEKIHVLLVDDDTDYGRLVERYLLSNDDTSMFRMERIPSFAEAVRRLTEQSFDLVLLDLGLPDAEDLGVLEQCKNEFPQLPVVVLTAQSDENIGIAAIQKGADDYLVKQYTNKHLLVRCIRYTLERRRQAEQLRQSEERYRHITQTITDYIYTVKIENGHVVNTLHSPACVIVTGYSDEEFDRDPYLWFHMVHEEDRNALQRHVEKVMINANVDSMEHRILRRDGQVRWVRNTPVRHYDPYGKLASYDGLVQDITEQKEAEEALRESESMLRSTLESTADGILVSDIEGNIIQVNPRFAIMWNIPVELMQDRNNRRRLHYVINQLENPREFLEKVQQLYQSSKEGFDTIHFKDGRVFERYSCPLRQKGKMVGRVWNFRDVTTQKQGENALKKAKEAAEEISRAKSQFLANMSHEIRSPLNAIIGFSEVLEEEALNDEQHKYALIIREAGENLLALLEDILDFSKMEAERVETEQIECSLKELLCGVALLMTPQAQKKHLDFQIVAQTVLPDTIYSDLIRLRQCLINLINNAIKFTDSGHVRVKVALETRRGKHYIRFDVEDTGIGIPPEKQQSIFTMFVQADSDTTRKYGGTGLGLAITKNLAELMQGGIMLDSTPNQGSTFTLIIPAGSQFDPQATTWIQDQYQFGRERRQKKPAERRMKFQGHCLAAEDNPANRMLIHLLLSDMGLEVTLVEDGQQVLERLNDQSFDLILMDMQMPILNGYETVRKIRARGLTTPIVAITADAEKDSPARCLEAGCDSYVEKPITRQTLTQALKRFLKPLSPNTLQPESPQTALTTTTIPDSDLRSELHDDPDMIEVIQVFIRDLPNLLHNIVQAWENENLNALQSYLHELKGAGGSAGFSALADIATTIEQQLRSSQINTLTKELDTLNQTSQKILTAYTQ
jgi:PAS domain S-box-containing protein